MYYHVKIACYQMHLRCWGTSLDKDDVYYRTNFVQQKIQGTRQIEWYWDKGTEEGNYVTHMRRGKVDTAMMGGYCSISLAIEVCARQWEGCTLCKVTCNIPILWLYFVGKHGVMDYATISTKGKQNLREKFKGIVNAKNSTENGTFSNDLIDELMKNWRTCMQHEEITKPIKV